MQRSLSIAIEHYPIAGQFAISRGSRTMASVAICTIRDGERTGRGECVPYARYGESTESVENSIREMTSLVESGLDRAGLIAAMPAGAARNAIDCALWDLALKSGSARPGDITGGNEPAPLLTAYTISFGTAEQMARHARAAADRPLLKIKLGGNGDDDRIQAVRLAAPHSRLVGDANEGWRPDNVERNLAAAAEAGFEWIEQPLPAGEDAILARIARPIPVCADESVHVSHDLEALRHRYDAINIKLDKAGGLTEAISMRERARALGYAVMVGCMLGTSLAMAPAVLLAQGADLVDLDGPLLLARDREPALQYEGSRVFPPQSELWG